MKKILLLMIVSLVIAGCSSENEEKTIETITAIKLSQSELSIKIGEEQTLTVEYSPSNLPAPSYKWSSSDTDIVSVTNGNIKALNVGKATITVTVPNSNLSSSCKVIILPVEASSIKLSSNSETMEIGETIGITYTIEPNNTTNKDVEWTSSNTGIAIVSDGNITAISDGQCEIKVKTKGSEISDKCIISVNPIKVSGITFSENNRTIEKGESFTLDVNIQPNNAKDKSVIWTSSNTSIATVEDGVVKAINKGSCEIAATTVDGNFKAVCLVTVTPISIKSISFDENNIVVLESDQTQLTYQITPSNAEDKSVVFSSTDDNIASVDANGYLTANNIGSTTIKVITNEGSHTAICNVTVSSITNFITLSYNTSEIGIGGIVRISASSTIKNNSTKSIILTKFTAINPFDNSIIQETTDQSKLGELVPNSSKNLGLTLTNKIYPTFRWTLEFNGKSYSKEVVY